MQALEGIRVVDFTQVIAGPYATYQLASLGADVVKLEQPVTGDQGRAMLALTPAAQASRMSALFTAVNGGKRSLTLDLKHPGALAVVEKLVREADVVVENFKAGTMERLGLGPDVLTAFKPNLVYCRISGYGQSGPRASAATYDPVVQAVSGMMSVTGSDETGPMKVGFWVVDTATGLNAAFAITAALLRRAATGRGEVLDVAMLDSAVSMLSPQVGLYMNYGIEPPFTGNGTPGVGGGSTVYPTLDGYITIAAATDAQFRTLMHAIGRPELTEDPRFNSREARVANAAAYRAEMIAGLSTDSASSWEARLAQVGVPAGANQPIAHLPDDPQVRHRQLFRELDPAPGLDGPFHAVSIGFRASGEVPGVRRPPPSVGQHTHEVLAELGYGTDDIAQLRRDGIV